MSVLVLSDLSVGAFACAGMLAFILCLAGCLPDARVLTFANAVETGIDGGTVLVKFGKSAVDFILRW